MICKLNNSYFEKKKFKLNINYFQSINQIEKMINLIFNKL